jgi:prepilin-type N-terminal cleavage/methylation domain-containing protein
MSASNDYKKKSIKATQAGFTLVEIAIVLVIIGLLLGGILKGQEMITQAKIKNVINDFNGITAAVTSYQDRYRAIPGDDQGANARWVAQAPATDANKGDGIVWGLYNANNQGGTLGAPAAAAESNLFWQHLRIAGFIAGPTSGLGSGSPPPNATGGIIGVETGGGCGGNCGQGMGFTSLVMCTSNLPDKVAIAVDTQVDDGAPGTGQVRGALQSAPSPVAPATGNTTPYAETGTNQYLLCKNI